MWKTFKNFIIQIQRVRCVAPSVAVAVIIGNTLGAFNLLEWSIRDQFFRWRPLQPIDKRIVVVTIDEADIKAIGDWPIPDAILAQLLINIRQQEPQVIGLDLYRDLPEGAGHRQLIEVFETTPQLIGVEKITESRVAPSPILEALRQVAIADVVLDGDRHVRRALLSMADPDTGAIRIGLGTQAALKYLQNQGITIDIDPVQQRTQLGRAVFHPMLNRAAGYGPDDLAGYQILMDWRGQSDRFLQISMQDVLEGKSPEGLMRDRIVYIGSTATSTNDFFATPYSGGFQTKPEPMAGVFVHANITSQLLDSALDGRNVLWGWTTYIQWGWILCWAILGTVGTWWIELQNHQEEKKRLWLLRPTLVTGVTASILLVGGYLSFLAGTLIPLVPSLAALGLSAGITTNIFKKHRLELANKQLELVNQQLLDHADTLESKVKDRTHELAEAKRIADSANQAKSDFLANMSHELRTPLNGILGYTQILQHSLLIPKEAQDKIDIIHQCGSHLLTLINDILDISKIEARKLEIFPLEVNLPLVMQNIAEIFNVRAEEKGIRFNLMIDPSIPKYVFLDEKRFRQVFINIIGNAIKFTDQGDITVKVTLRGIDEAIDPHILAQQGIPLTEQPSLDHRDHPLTPGPESRPDEPVPAFHMCHLRFWVEDTGIGMSPEQLEKIFLPFEQVGDNRRKAAGTGLGLAISQQILTLMGSHLHVQSRLGEGSIFWADLQLPATIYEHKETPTPSSQHIVGIQGSSPNILIIEDCRDDCLLMAHFLQAIGCMTHTAVDGLTGITMAQQQQPDLIIVDLIMRPLNGVEFLQTLQRYPSINSVPVIMVSASVSPQDQKRSLAAGATAFLPKPVNFKRLLDLLQTYLKVAWVYAPESSSQLEPQGLSGGPTNNVPEPIVPPSLQILKELHHLAMMGHLQGIKEKLEEITVEGQQLQPFVQRLNTLVDNFQVKQIQTFLQSYFSSDPSL